MCLSLVPLVPEAQATGLEWVAENDMPVERSYFASAELPGNRAFLTMGYDGDASGYGNDAWMVDLGTMNWTKLADAPKAVASATAAYADRKVYVFGGTTMSEGFVTTVLIYALEANA